MNDEHLEAELERLDAQCQRMANEYCELAKSHANLKADINRITKAGDAMQTYISDFSKICKPQWDVRLAWEAAKLGIEE